MYVSPEFVAKGNRIKMKKLISLLVVIVCIVGVEGKTAKANIAFDLPVDFNLATGGGGIYGGPGDYKNIVEIALAGMAVSNMVDNGDNVISLGDQTLTVAAGRITTYTPQFGADIDGNSQVTIVFTGKGKITALGGDLTDPNDITFTSTLDSLTIQMFIQDANDGIVGFNPLDVTTWGGNVADADEFISFSIAGPFNNEINAIDFSGPNNPGNTVAFGGLAVDPPPVDILRIHDGGAGVIPTQDPLFITRGSTQDDPGTNNAMLLTGIIGTSAAQQTALDALWLGAGNVGSFFADPFIPGFTFNANGEVVTIDLAANVSGPQAFDVVPEPSSVVLMAMGGLALAGVAIRRRRNAKKVA